MFKCCWCGKKIPLLSQAISAWIALKIGLLISINVIDVVLFFAAHHGGGILFVKNVR
jgi:hypothetical protein